MKKILRVVLCVDVMLNINFVNTTEDEFVLPEEAFNKTSEDEFVLPEVAFNKVIDALISGLNEMSSTLFGTRIIAPYEAILSTGAIARLPQSEQVRLRSTYGNPIIEIRDRNDHLHYLEVFSQTDNGGQATYEDRNGKLCTVLWNESHEIIFDSHPCHILGGLTVPDIMLEPQKSIVEGLGLTSTILEKNGSGGVKRKPGTISSQLTEIFKLVHNIKSSVPETKDIQELDLKIDTGFAAILNCLHQQEKQLAIMKKQQASINQHIWQALMMLLDLVRNSTATKCKYSTIDQPALIRIPQSWHD
ncbi:MAG: hypothetical protein LBD36_02675 [Holosporales bacterium]|jgi:hypothetical protein|nr:hypothetical protein [Holosporales bacterium]